MEELKKLLEIILSDELQMMWSTAERSLFRQHAGMGRKNFIQTIQKKK